MLLLKTVERILERGGFDYCFYDGCFDIAASRNFTMFLKVLTNVDSLQPQQANNLKIIAENMNATIGVVGLHTRREHLEDRVIYERFDVPTFTPNTLDSIVSNDLPVVSRARGGLLAEIDAARLREKRNSAGLTQSELARRVGVTKKNIYEHEREDKKADLSMVEKIEKILGDVTNKQSIRRPYSFEKNEPRSRFELIVSRDLKHMGFGTDFVYQSPFNLTAKESKTMIISRAEENKRKVEKDSPFISSLSSVTKVPAVVITKDELNIDIPSIQEKDLKHMKSRDMRKFIR